MNRMMRGLYRIKIFGIRLYILNILLKFLDDNGRMYLYFVEKKHRIIKEWMVSKFSQEIHEFKINSTRNSSKKIIWVFWDSGVESMPFYIKESYENLKRKTEETVKLITDDNLSKYIEIPLEILDKKKRGMISSAMFSDLVRNELITLYGGLYVDLRIWFLKKIPVDIFDYEFWSRKYHGEFKQYVSNTDWTAGFIAGKRNNLVTSFCSYMIKSYFSKYDFQIDYFLIDYIIAIGYDHIHEIKLLIDNIPNNNPQFNLLRESTCDKITISNDKNDLAVLLRKDITLKDLEILNSLEV